MTTTLAKTILSPEHLLYRRRIAAFSEQTIALFQAARAEQRKLRQQGVWTEKEADAFLEAETFADCVSGYASYTETQRYATMPTEALQEMKCNSIFDKPDVENLCRKHKNDAPKTYRYLEAVDYLRLLLVEYINQFESDKPC